MKHNCGVQGESSRRRVNVRETTGGGTRTAEEICQGHSPLAVYSDRFRSFRAAAVDNRPARSVECGKLLSSPSRAIDGDYRRRTAARPTQTCRTQCDNPSTGCTQIVHCLFVRAQLLTSMSYVPRAMHRESHRMTKRQPCVRRIFHPRFGQTGSVRTERAMGVLTLITSGQAVERESEGEKETLDMSCGRKTLRGDLP